MTSSPQGVETQAGHWPDLRVFAFDHRLQLEEMPGANRQKIGAFKQLCLRAAKAVQAGQDGYGVLCDGRLGQDTLDELVGSGLWVGRPVEWPGSRPLKLEPELRDDFSGLANWHGSQTLKCLCFCHPDDDSNMWRAQEDTVKSLYDATKAQGLKFLLEVIPSKVGPVSVDTTARLIQRFYDLGVYPNWWKLEPFKTDAEWAAACDAIHKNDPDVFGIVVLGLDAPVQELFDSFARAAQYDLVKGFAVGRSIFGDTARAWMLGQISDDTAVDQMAKIYKSLCDTWDKARAQGKEDVA